MKIIIDAMSGDNAPEAIVRGAALAVKTLDCELTLVGKEDVIRTVLEKENLSSRNISIINASEVITMEDEPTRAVRSKKDSSMVVATTLVKENYNSVCISAGNTGALLTSALFNTGRIKGVSRPALAVILPANRPILLIDGGANAECKSEYFVQFARIATVYMSEYYNIKNPRVALANIGVEEHKGSTLYSQTYQLLKADEKINFVGNVEGTNFFTDVCDIIVADGFTGNIILKTVEGTFKHTMSMVKNVLTKNIFNKLAALVLKKDLGGIKRSIDPNRAGGAIFLGIDGGVIKIHGSSNEYAVESAVKQAILFQEKNVLEKIKNILI